MTVKPNTLLQCPKCPGRFNTLEPGSHVCSDRLWPRPTVVVRSPPTTEKGWAELKRAFERAGK